MEEIILKNRDNKIRFNYFVSKYKKSLSDKECDLIKLILLNYKQYIKKEENLVFAFIYGIDFFIGLEEGLDELSIEEKDKLDNFKRLYEYEKSFNPEKLIKGFYNLEKDLLLLKILIKYTVTSENEQYLSIVENKENYYKMIGFIIPLLTLKGIPFLNYFQDIYFKELYKEKFLYIKKYYLEYIDKSPIPGENLVDIMNNLNNILFEIEIFGILKLRKKSYFSLYNKVKRKLNKKILDNIGVRIIFKNNKDLFEFAEKFEEKYLYIKKKNYIISPKINGYKSLHYTYISTSKFGESLVELQLRSEKDDKDIIQDELLNHYNYTIDKKKWSKEFGEIHLGEKILKKILKKS